MKKYEELNSKQQSYIDFATQMFPNAAKSGVITRKEIKVIKETLRNKKKAGETVSIISSTKWLKKDYTIKAGSYVFPAKGIDPSKIANTANVNGVNVRTATNNVEQDKEFFKSAISSQARTTNAV
jgi:hypothetical protein